LVTTQLGEELFFNSLSAKLNGIVATNSNIHSGLMLGLT
jgi:hypothetical protein